MKKILYVEDDPINAFVILKLLATDFHVSHVPDGETCLTLIQEEQFDCILMDINLGKGKMDGIQAMKKVRELAPYKTVPIFALTSYAMPEDEKRFLSDGFDFYLSKPIERRVLIQHINTFIG
jgi:CheY-like chemotaxis protein